MAVLAMPTSEIDAVGILDGIASYIPTESVPLFVLAVILILVILFIVLFLVPSILLQRRLRSAIRIVRTLKGRHGTALTDLAPIADKAMAEEPMAHLWREYVETLHAEKQANQRGEMVVVRWRATAMGELFFTEQALVDTPLRTEFFKHIPGILTGLGIIGTFAGLITGVTGFEFSNTNPKLLEVSLRDLLKAVSQAFIVSAIAIFLAILFTGLEKTIVTVCYRQVEKLRHLIDSLFHAGIGEEYLARLVKASETSATQALQIKDVLVADLKEVLSELSAQQIAAAERQSNQLAEHIGRSISESISDPVRRIASAVESVGASQGDAVNKLLTDVLARFSSEMHEMFGGQLQGIGDVLAKAGHAMESTVAKFDQLAEHINAAGKDAAGTMAEQVQRAIAALEVRQKGLTDELSGAIEQIRTTISTSQTQSNKELHAALTAVTQQVNETVQQLREQAAAAQDEHAAQSRNIALRAEQSTTALSGQIEKLLAQSAESNRSLQGTVASLADITKDSLQRMQSGAETLSVAASDFARAGLAVAETMKASATVADRMTTASQALSASTGHTQTVLEEFKTTRDTFAAIVADLRATIETAKREASLTDELVSKLRMASDALAGAKLRADEYLKGVSEVLAKAHESFAENLTRTLDRSNAKFYEELMTAVSLISGSIRDLDQAFEALPRSA